MRKFVTVASFILCVATIILSPFILHPTQKQLSQKSYKAIIKIWHIDTFEGGIGSRANFLKSVANDFSKSHTGILFLVVTHTVNSARESFEKGQVPDVVSLGACGLDLQKYLKEIKIKGINDGGTIDGKRYFLSWLKGCYFKVEKGNSTKQKVIISNGEYNSAIYNYQNVADTSKALILPPKEAYSRFLIEKDCVLYGTQRDVVKLQNDLEKCAITPLTQYSDLFQYACITSDDTVKVEISKNFLEYLISEKVQQKLTNIKMFSPYYTTLYAGEPYFENAETLKVNYAIKPYLSDSDFKMLKNGCISNVNDGKTNTIDINYFKQL